MTPWVRMCSNGAGHPAVKKPRFVFRGGKGFYDTYGFSQDSPNSSKYQIIGYMPTNPPIPHIIENSLRNPSLQGQEQSNYPIHVPTPEINKITVTIQKELFRRAEVEWTCFSWEQLVYMTPYFMVPRISVMLEWGWNHFNPRSLVPLEDEIQMSKLWRNAYPLYTQNIILSKGNYDVLYGFITNFNWSMEGNRINCVTEITSKDRLYAGISKDMGLTVNDNSNTNTPRPIFQALRDFISKDATFQNIQSIAEAEPGTKLFNLTGGQTSISGSIHGAETQNIIWRDILSPILSNPDPKIRGMKVPYIHGVFSGRPKKFWNYPNAFGKPQKYDFDKSTEDKIVANKIWVNMGLIVEILNYFSGLPGGKGEPMFQVDILNSVIGGHPNMISCNRDVLIPNRHAPKFHFGAMGMLNYGPAPGDKSSPYHDQVVNSQLVSSPADVILRRVCYQSAIKVKNDSGPGGLDVCYRNDLDHPINFLRYLFKTSTARRDYLGHTNYMESFSFPAIADTVLPPSDNGLAASTTSSPNAKQGNVVEANISGLLSDIYISYSAFSGIVLETDSKMASFVDIYHRILSLLNSAVDDFWDLTLVEVDGVMTIMDKNYLGTQSKLGHSDPTYSFDYFDSDSIMRAFRFRPALSDAQATRAIFGEVNNSGSKYVYVDKNDLLDYKFKDAIVLNDKDATQGDPNDDVNKRRTAINQMRDLIGDAQKFVTQEGDDSIQMTVNKNTANTLSSGISSGFSGFGVTSIEKEEVGPFEILKFCLPSAVSKQLFRLLIDDHDENNNNRYCAIQPGITAEMTLQGIGGLRTFQYFLIKNLPAPYSHRDIIFRITNVEQIITQEGGGWDTKVTAGILPLRKYIKNRLAPPRGGWAEPTNATTS